MVWGKGSLRRGKKIRDERFESVRGECVIFKVYIYEREICVKVDTQSSSLEVNVTEFRFELGVEHDVVKTKHVVICFLKVNS